MVLDILLDGIGRRVYEGNAQLLARIVRNLTRSLTFKAAVLKGIPNKKSMAKESLIEIRAAG